jgi:hypothetical protein
VAASSADLASPSGLALFLQMESQVQALRGLSPTSAVRPILLDATALAGKLTAINSAQTDHQALANESQLFMHLGLLPAGSSLEQLELELDSGQVVGFYDPASKGLYVLSSSGSVGATEEVTFSHEYTHALQDQNFGLDKLDISAPGQSDRDLARTALPEGDATLLMSMWSARYLSLVELMQIAGQSLSGPQAAQLAAAPAILRETLMFPYQAGLSFVEGVYAGGGWAAVNQLYRKPPTSTSQILHPELYTAGVQPVSVNVPAAPASLPGWALTTQDTLGELQLRVWLGSGTSGAAPDAAATAVSSWGGDRVALYDGPNGQWAVLLRTTWRTSAGRDDFMQAATITLGGLSREYRICGAPSEVEVAIASSAAVLPAFLDCNPMG